jgi:hypothetical protein
VSELIGTLDVEERARAKDGRGKGVETFAANMVQKKNSFALRKNKKKKRRKRTTQNPSRQLSLRRRTIITRREVALFVVVMSIG